MKRNNYNKKKDERSSSPFELKKKFCPFSKPGSPNIDYKDIRLLSRYITENGKIIPGVAISWTKDPSGKVYTFKLRKNAKWSDGSPVTSKDFVYSWKRLVSSPSSYQDYLASAGVLNAAEIVNGNDINTMFQ